MLLKSHHTRSWPSLFAAVAALALCALPATVTLAAEPPEAAPQDGGDLAVRTFEIGDAKIRWHFDTGPDPSPRIAELIDEYRRLSAQRWSGDAAKTEPRKPAEVEPLPGGNSLVRVPARFIHTMSVRVGAGGELVPRCVDGTAAATAGAAIPDPGKRSE